MKGMILARLVQEVERRSSIEASLFRQIEENDALRAKQGTRAEEDAELWRRATVLAERDARAAADVLQQRNAEDAGEHERVLDAMDALRKAAEAYLLAPVGKLSVAANSERSALEDELRKRMREAEVFQSARIPF